MKPNPVDSFEYSFTNDSTSVLLNWTSLLTTPLLKKSKVLESRLKILSKNNWDINKTLVRHVSNRLICLFLADLALFKDFTNNQAMASFFKSLNRTSMMYPVC